MPVFYANEINIGMTKSLVYSIMIKEGRCVMGVSVLPMSFLFVCECVSVISDNWKFKFIMQSNQYAPLYHNNT